MIEGVELRAVLLICSIQFVYTDTHMQASIHTHVYVRTHTHVYARTHDTHARAHTHTHTNRWILWTTRHTNNLGEAYARRPPGHLSLRKTPPFPLLWKIVSDVYACTYMHSLLRAHTNAHTFTHIHAHT